MSFCSPTIGIIRRVGADSANSDVWAELRVGVTKESYRTNTEDASGTQFAYPSAVRSRLIILLTPLLIAACRRAPNRDESLQAIRAVMPDVESTTVMRRVWADGPPWFSCAEVIAKFRSRDDSRFVRNQVGNWRALLLANWVALRDSAARDVVEPGWCVAYLRDEPARLRDGWVRVHGDSQPMGHFRRGWSVNAGRHKLDVAEKPILVGKDSALAEYLITVVPNASGVALDAAKDTSRHRALLRKEEGRWRVVQ